MRRTQEKNCEGGCGHVFKPMAVRYGSKVELVCPKCGRRHWVELKTPEELRLQDLHSINDAIYRVLEPFRCHFGMGDPICRCLVAAQAYVDKAVEQYVAQNATVVRPAVCSEFRLPVVEGRRASTSNADFERACLVHIERLQHGLGPYDSAMMATFCEAVRMVREYSDAMQIRTPNATLSVNESVPSNGVVGGGH